MERLCPGLVAEIAIAARHWEDIESKVVALIDGSVGADTLFFAEESGPTASLRGVLQRRSQHLTQIWKQLNRDPKMAGIAHAAVQRGGVVVDAELFGSELRKQRHYELLMRPLRGKTTLFAPIPGAGSPKCELVLGRCERSPHFNDTEKRTIAELLPTLALARRALLAAPGKASVLCPALTPREREVLEYLELGYTNQEIGRALGTQARTVRNQLTRVYAKLEVSNRAEAVGLLKRLS